MKLSRLLVQRDALLRQMHLANLAFAYARLSSFAERVDRVGLRGVVSLKRADPDAGQPWPVLIALSGSQAVLEEHFSEEDVIDFSDVIGWATEERDAEVVFDLADIRAHFVEPVLHALESAGVEIGDETDWQALREDREDSRGAV